MNPCLKEAEISAFEKRYHIELPQDYRLFLMEVGNGGKGPPYYGLGGWVVRWFKNVLSNLPPPCIVSNGR
jgi:hypothetical protein